MNDQVGRNLKTWYFLAIFLLSTLAFLWLLWPFVSVIVLAAVITSVFLPVFDFLKKRISSWLSSLITCVLIFLILFVPMIFFVGALSQEAYGLYKTGRDAVVGEKLQTLLSNNQLVESANQFLARFNYVLTGEEVNKAISDLGKAVGLFLYQQASAIATNVLTFLIYFFFMLMFIYFFLVDGQKLIDFIIDLSPLQYEQDKKLIQRFNEMAGAILIGNGLNGLIQGFLGGILFFLFGLKSPFLWGVIISLVAIIPVIGTGLVFIPAAIYLYLIDRVAASVFFIVFFVVLFVFMEYFFKPKLVGNRVKIHALLVFLSIIGGVKLLGILGIIYGPLIVTVFLTLTEIYRSNYQNLFDCEDSDKNENL